MVTDQALDDMSCTINFVHCLGVKNHLLFSHILHMICFYIPELFPVPKYILFVSCFQVVCRPLVPRSGDYEQCRLKLAATFLCTTGNQAHCKAAPPYSPAQMQIFHAFRKTMFCGHLYDYQCSLLWLCSGG